MHTMTDKQQKRLVAPRVVPVPTEKEGQERVLVVAGLVREEVVMFGAADVEKGRSLVLVDPYNDQVPPMYVPVPAAVADDITAYVQRGTFPD